MPSKEEQLNPSSDGAFSFSFHSCSPRKLLLIHLISSYPPAQDTGSAASTFQSNFHVHSSRHFLLPGTLWPISSQSPGCPGMPCPVLSSRDSPQHSSLPKPAQPSTSSPGAAHQIPNGNLLAPSAMFPIIPSPMGHLKGVIKPLQKSPGDPPALPWVCCPEGTQPSAHPWSWISSGGSIPQEQQLCSTRRGTEGKNKHRRTKCASVQGPPGLWLALAWSWLSAVLPLVPVPAKASFPHPKNPE